MKMEDELEKKMEDKLEKKMEDELEKKWKIGVKEVEVEELNMMDVYKYLWFAQE
jgi:hypothetical protein